MNTKKVKFSLEQEFMEHVITVILYPCNVPRAESKSWCVLLLSIRRYQPECRMGVRSWQSWAP